MILLSFQLGRADMLVLKALAAFSDSKPGSPRSSTARLGWSEDSNGKEGQELRCICIAVLHRQNVRSGPKDILRSCPARCSSCCMKKGEMVRQEYPRGPHPKPRSFLATGFRFHFRASNDLYLFSLGRTNDSNDNAIAKEQILHQLLVSQQPAMPQHDNMANYGQEQQISTKFNKSMWRFHTSIQGLRLQTLQLRQMSDPHNKLHILHYTELYLWKLLSWLSSNLCKPMN